MLVRCNTDLGAELFRSSYLTLSVHHYGWTIYYNYKGFLSIVVLAVIDSNYKFIWMDVGSPGSCFNAGIFNRSRLEPGLRKGTIGLPQPNSLPYDDRDTPYYMVGDDASPFGNTCLSPTLIVTWHGTSGSSVAGVSRHDVWLKMRLVYLPIASDVF